jgi:uncharacterized protein YndB with AHSA1/START domain
MSRNPDEHGESLQAKTVVERVSDRELLVTRRFDAPARILFRAWSQADLFRQWWVPKSYGINLLSCTMDVRTGGAYRLEFEQPVPAPPMAFFGTYLDVVPDARIVWTNEESEDGPVTTVSFEDRGEQTTVTVRNQFPSKEALDRELESGGTGALSETLAQLEAFVLHPGARNG